MEIPIGKAAAYAVALGAALALLAARAEATGVFRMRRLVVVGDSILAGFGNGGLVVRGTVGQRNDAPALIAHQAGVRLPQPLMSFPGVPPPLRIDDVDRNGQLDRGDVRRKSNLVGFRRNLGRARNLAVPGESVQSVFETVDAQGVAKGLVDRTISGRDILKFLILGFPLRDDPVSQLTRANGFRPSFLVVWLGNNDVLPMATQTNPQAVALSAAAFGMEYRRFLNRLADTGADMVVANLPDVTQIAALRRAGTDVTSCQNDVGLVVTVPPDALLSIALSPAKLPVPPCGKVLLPADQTQIRATVIAFNTEIATAIAEVEQQRGIAIAPVDMFGLFDGVARNGYDVSGDGSLILSSRYLGGLFSLDGVHPTRTGQALIANAFIDAIDTRFGETIAHVDVGRIAARDPLVGNSFRPVDEPPFGLVADQGIDVTDALDDALGRLADNAGDIFKDLKHRAKDFFGGIF